MKKEKEYKTVDYCVLASDYDGTLADYGLVRESTLAALRRWKESGRTFVLITGRSVELLTDFLSHNLTDLLVGENGGILYNPQSGEEQVIGVTPPHALLEMLYERGVEMYVAKSMIASFKPYEKVIEDSIRTLHLDWRIIRNKEDIMVLPPQVNKAYGLHAALDMLGESLEHTVGVGDAENDEDFLAICGYAVAVANALPTLKERADLVTQGERGNGVAELIDHLLRDEQ